MRILFVAWRDLANELAGGSEVLIDHLAAGLTERGHDVTLLCANPVGGPRAYKVAPNGGTVDQYLRRRSPTPGTSATPTSWSTSPTGCRSTRRRGDGARRSAS